MYLDSADLVSIGLFTTLLPLKPFWIWFIIGGTASSLYCLWLNWGDKFIFTHTVMSFLCGAVSPQLTCGLLFMQHLNFMYHKSISEDRLLKEKLKTIKEQDKHLER